ncbi:MAG: hypothetical protein JKY23_04340 [Nitrospinaceae bacterium]|nr:hypothetical protein [Nitrospinaceae bacterium]
MSLTPCHITEDLTAAGYTNVPVGEELLVALEEVIMRRCVNMRCGEKSMRVVQCDSCDYTLCPKHNTDKCVCCGMGICESCGNRLPAAAKDHECDKDITGKRCDPCNFEWPHSDRKVKRRKTETSSSSQ